jgi:hypothetical protein
MVFVELMFDLQQIKPVFHKNGSACPIRDKMLVETGTVPAAVPQRDGMWNITSVECTVKF